MNLTIFEINYIQVTDVTAWMFHVLFPPNNIKALMFSIIHWPFKSFRAVLEKHLNERNDVYFSSTTEMLKTSWIRTLFYMNHKNPTCFTQFIPQQIRFLFRLLIYLGSYICLCLPGAWWKKIFKPVSKMILCDFKILMSLSVRL